MRHQSASKDGHIAFDKSRGTWNARIWIDDHCKSYRSPYRQDCERWLQEVKACRLSYGDAEWITKEIISYGGTNPKQVPDFPCHFFTDENELWSFKQNRLRKLKPRNAIGSYFLTSDNDGISMTRERIRYCVDNNISPLSLSRAKLSISKGTMELEDVTEYIKKRIKEDREKDIREHAEEYMEVTEKWCSNVLAFYRGEKDAAVKLQNILEQVRPFLVAYVHDVMLIRNDDKVRFIVDEVMSETMYRTLNKESVIYAPYPYMKALARAYKWIIQSVRGTAMIEDGRVRIIGCRKKESLKQIYKNAM